MVGDLFVGTIDCLAGCWETIPWCVLNSSLFHSPCWIFRDIFCGFHAKNLVRTRYFHLYEIPPCPLLSAAYSVPMLLCKSPVRFPFSSSFLSRIWSGDPSWIRFSNTFLSKYEVWNWRACDIFSLSKRRLRGDMTKSISKIKWSQLPKYLFEFGSKYLHAEDISGNHELFSAADKRLWSCYWNN